MHSRGSLLLTLLRSLESQCRSNAHFLPFGRKKKEEGRRIRCGWWSESISGASYELFALNFHLTLNLPFASSLSLFGTGRIRRPPPLIQSVSARTDHDRTMTCRLPLPPILIDFLIASFWQEFAGGYFPNFNLIKMLLSLSLHKLADSTDAHRGENLRWFARDFPQSFDYPPASEVWSPVDQLPLVSSGF